MERVKKINVIPKENPYNCIAHYRWEKGLPYRQLAALLGCTGPFSACIACTKERADLDYVKRLAEAEGVSVEAFLLLYREGELM